MFELYKKIANLVGGRERERDRPSRLGVSTVSTVSTGLQFKDSALFAGAVVVVDDTVNAEHHCIVNIKCPVNILIFFVLRAD